MNQEIIELFEDLLEKQGFSRMFGQILALIYLKEVKLTQEDLQKASNFSRSSINKAVNTLQNLGYIRKRQMGDGKKLVYYTDWGAKEILLSGVQEYISYFDKVFGRFSKLFETSAKIEGLAAKKLKDFIEHLPQVNEILKNAIQKINDLDLIFE